MWWNTFSVSNKSARRRRRVVVGGASWCFGELSANKKHAVNACGRTSPERFTACFFNLNRVQHKTRRVSGVYVVTYICSVMFTHVTWPNTANTHQTLLNGTPDDGYGIGTYEEGSPD